MDEDRSFATKELIKLAPRLKEFIPNLKILAVGGGNDEETAKHLADEANKACGAETVILTGARTDINKLAAVADLFVGVSRAALEAMAAGKNTVIAGNEGFIGLFDENCLQIGIDTNFCCRGCKETTGELIFEAVKTYYEKTADEKQKMSDYCRETVLKHYSVSRMTDDCEAAYNSLDK